ncbi:MAG: ATP synthase F1 subunit delta [Patescibacteria group bacterium]|mgnify:CR=1 FL=1
MRKDSPRDYAVALYESTKDAKGSELKTILKQFTELIFKAGQVRQIEKIIAEYFKYSKLQEGITDIEITSARPLTAKLVNEIKKAFGNKVEATEGIDADLIGGVKIKTENKILDASLRHQLQLLKQTLS